MARQEAAAEMAAVRGVMEEKMREAREAQEVQARAAREALQSVHDALEKHKARADPSLSLAGSRDAPDARGRRRRGDASRAVDALLAGGDSMDVYSASHIRRGTVY